MHCMQSLNVDIFQSYKHCHDRAIQNALAELSFEYNVQFFLCDLSTIQTNIFKKMTIWHVFRKSEMWSIDTKQCLKQLKTFNSSHKTKIDESTLSWTSIVSWTSMNVDKDLKRWNQHLESIAVVLLNLNEIFLFRICNSSSLVEVSTTHCVKKITRIIRTADYLPQRTI